MASESEHKISETTIQSEQEHTQKLIEHGTSVEKLGKTIQTQKDSATESSKLIKEHDQDIKQKTEKRKEYLKELEETYSIEAYVQLEYSYIKAAKEHIEAIKKLLKETKNRRE